MGSLLLLPWSINGRLSPIRVGFAFLPLRRPPKPPMTGGRGGNVSSMTNGMQMVPTQVGQ
jgi:hypothetical protein